MFTLLILLGMSIISAQTLITGKVYNSNYNFVSEAAVKIYCTHNGTTYDKDTVTLSDGTFAVKFDYDTCFSGDYLRIASTKASMSGEDTGNVLPCTEECVGIVNIVIKQPGQSTTQSNGGGGGGGSSSSLGYYLCGNGKCESGESVKLCPKDCKCDEKWECSEWSQCSQGIQLRNCKETNNCTQFNKPVESQNCTVVNNSSSKSAGITGAVIGTVKDNVYTFMGIFIIVVVAGAIAVYVFRPEKK